MVRVESLQRVWAKKFRASENYIELLEDTDKAWQNHKANSDPAHPAHLGGLKIFSDG
jgi:hypothetical protein